EAQKARPRTHRARSGARLSRSRPLNLNRSKRIGLVATNSIRGGANRRLVDDILSDARIFDAWSDEAWVVDGAAVRVSLPRAPFQTNRGQDRLLVGHVPCRI